MESLLHVQHVSCGRHQRRRLDDIDLTLASGERLAILGANGAGKSTLLQVIAGVLAAQSGQVFVAGQAISSSLATRGQIGYLPQRLPLYPELTVSENLAWAGRLHGLRGDVLTAAMEAQLEKLKLVDVRRRLAGHLSAGMAQRLGLAQALVHSPALLLLDEPTAGLDPLHTEQLRALLKALPEDVGLVLATHLLDDVRALCERVMLMDGGRIVATHRVDDELDLLAQFRLAAGGQLHEEAL